MPPRVSPETWAKFDALIDKNWDATAASRKVGINPETGKLRVQARKKRKAAKLALISAEFELPDPVPDQSELGSDARRALTDFEFFRLRYFGHVSMPWQVEAAEAMIAWLESEDKEFVVVNCPPGAGKALALDTPIPTPAGWSTMGDLRVGDEVLHPSGGVVSVTAKSEVMVDRPCFEVTTSDGHSIVADADHEWELRIAGRKERRVYTTKFIARPSPKHGGQRPQRLQVDLTAPLDLPEVDLPVDPYVLGVFLGDGCWQTCSIAMDDADSEEVRRWVEKAGYETTDRNHPTQFGVLGLRVDLRAAGLDEGHKFVPSVYFRASNQQRLDLLQGLMDSDGSVRPDGLCVFRNTRMTLSSAVSELVLSLGGKARLSTTYPSGGRRPIHTVFFVLADAVRLSRKAKNLRVAARSKTRGLSAVAVDSVPVQCIQVSAPDGLFLAGRGFVKTHNSTLFTHDIPAWAMVRNRSTRILIGSRTERQARQYVGRLKTTFERVHPPTAGDGEKSKGLAVDATATLTEDFGRFKPTNPDVWRNEEFTVAQVGDIAGSDKERSVSAYGMDGGFLGGRYDMVIWDDLVDKRSMKTAAAREALINMWETEAETRLEPAGLLILQGQRLRGDDLYRYALDLKAGDPDDYADAEGEDSRPAKYRHVLYPAHADDMCTGLHAKTDPAWRSDGTGGCLLDPVRLDWKGLTTIAGNRAERYRVMYQQEDVDPADALLDRIWVYGGTDPNTSIDYPGCVDKDRGEWEVPPLAGGWFTCVTADPSPSMYWSVQLWAVHLASEQRFLIAHERRKMDVNEFLTNVTGTMRFTGLLVDWLEKATLIGKPFTHVIFEINAAQRYFLDSPVFKSWSQLTGVKGVRHATGLNKIDPDYGIQSTAGVWERGLVRLPWRGRYAQHASMKLIDEGLKYPHGSTTDCLMAYWFLEYNLPKLRDREAQLYRLPGVPSYMAATARRGILEVVA